MVPFPARAPLIIQRTFDPTHLNRVANHPEVRPWLLGDEDQDDLSAVILDPRNVTFQAPHGGFITLNLGYGRYDVHSLFLPSDRGARETVTAMREALEYMFARTDCVELVTKVPEGNRPAGVLAKLAHFEDLFTAPVSAKDPTRARYLTLSLDRWALHACDAARLSEWLHETLGEALPMLSPPLDAIQQQFLGATLLILQGGQVEKGVGFYNRWAGWTGYPAIRVLSTLPPVIVLEGTAISLSATGIEVL